MVKLLQLAWDRYVPKEPLNREELRTWFPDAAMLRASAMSQMANVPMMAGICRTTTTTTLARPITAPTPNVNRTTTSTGKWVFPSSDAQKTLVREMFPPTEASIAPETSGTSTARAARPARV